MKNGCYDPNEIPEILALPLDDPRRAHLEDCAECRILVASYTAFMNPETTVEPADRDYARAELSAFFTEKFGGKNEHGSSSNASRRFPRFIVYPTLAAAAALVLFLFTPMFQESPTEPPPLGVLRDVGPVKSAALQAERNTKGGYTLTWQQVPDVDAYQVVLYDAGQNELVRIDVADATTLSVDPNEWTSTAGEATVLWRLLGLNEHGGMIHRSPLEILRGP